MMSARSKPVIAVTGPDEGGGGAWACTAWALRRAGAIPLRVMPSRPLDPSLRIDGLVIGGGADVAHGDDDSSAEMPTLASEEPAPRRLAGFLFAPILYGLRRIASTRFSGIDTARDALEVELIERARASDVPVLGICRGAQLMNVHAGGTLLRDLSGYYTEVPQPWTPFPRKHVLVEPESHLGQALGCDACNVNSLHRHAIDRVGSSLRVVARETNGIVQAIEDPAHRFWVGVQWHPEYMPQVRAQMRLFRKFVAIAGEVRRERVSEHSSHGRAHGS